MHLICPKCGSKIVLKEGKYGKFYGCSNYPECKFTLNITVQESDIVEHEDGFSCSECGKYFEGKPIWTLLPIGLRPLCRDCYDSLELEDLEIEEGVYADDMKIEEKSELLEEKVLDESGFKQCSRCGRIFSPQKAYFNMCPECFEYSFGKQENVISPFKNSVFAEQFEYGKKAFYSGKYSEAIKYFDQAIKLAPESSIGWRMKGYVLYKMGEWTDAVYYLEKAIRLNSEDIDAQSLIEKILKKQESQSKN